MISHTHLGTEVKKFSENCAVCHFFSSFLKLLVYNCFSPGPCPTRWTKLPYADTCVKWYGDAERKSWEDARAACKQVGADLVKIANFSMNYYIFGKNGPVGCKCGRA